MKWLSIATVCPNPSCGAFSVPWKSLANFRIHISSHQKTYLVTTPEKNLRWEFAFAKTPGNLRKLCKLTTVKNQEKTRTFFTHLISTKRAHAHAKRIRFRFFLANWIQLRKKNHDDKKTENFHTTTKREMKKKNSSVARISLIFPFLFWTFPQSRHLCFHFFTTFSLYLFTKLGFLNLKKYSLFPYYTIRFDFPLSVWCAYFVRWKNPSRRKHTFSAFHGVFQSSCRVLYFAHSSVVETLGKAPNMLEKSPSGKLSRHSVAW